MRYLAAERKLSERYSIKSNMQASSRTAPFGRTPDWRARLIEWLPILIGIAVLFLPTYYDLDRKLWNTEDNAHGPIILLVALWFFWKKREALLAPAIVTRPVLGGVMLVLGLLSYAVGRSQQILLLEVGSEILILIGVLLLMRGGQAVKKLWFPLFFMIFLIPIPGFIVDAATVPLKHYISVLAEQILYLAGYPIARNGVLLIIGPYQLLVADACSGLNSMFSLSAMGILYLYIMQHTSKLRILLLLLSIWPIAFLANMMRVIVLTLVTYHLGDEAGQGFLHGFAGIMLFIAGLLFLMGLDGLLGNLLPDRPKGVKA